MLFRSRAYRARRENPGVWPRCERAGSAPPWDTVYAQLIESTSDPEQLEELALVIRRELARALRAEDGFCGLLSLVDRATGRSLLVVLWERDEEAARPLVRCGAPLLEAMSTLARLSTADPRAAVWEVGARG